MPSTIRSSPLKSGGRNAGRAWNAQAQKLSHPAQAATAAHRARRARHHWRADAAPDGRVRDCIEEAVAGTPGVHSYHTLRLRMMGGSVTLDVHVHVDPALSVVEGHDIATEVRARVLTCGCDVAEAVVHIEPCEDTHE